MTKLKCLKCEYLIIKADIPIYCLDVTCPECGHTQNIMPGQLTYRETTKLMNDLTNKVVRKNCKNNDEEIFKALIK